MDGFKVTNRWRHTTGEDQDDRRGSRGWLKKREQDNKKPKSHKGYGHEQTIFYSSVYHIRLYIVNIVYFVFFILMEKINF